MGGRDGDTGIVDDDVLLALGGRQPVKAARVEAGLHSRTYRAGRYSVARENGLHHFHVLLARALTGAAAPL